MTRRVTPAQLLLLLEWEPWADNTFYDQSWPVPGTNPPIRLWAHTSKPHTMIQIVGEPHDEWPVDNGRTLMACLTEIARLMELQDETQ